MNIEEAGKLINILKQVFSNVRLVDPSITKTYDINENSEFTETAYECFFSERKGRKCSSCISAKAFTTKNEAVKFEFLNKSIFLGISKYIEINDRPFLLEIIKKIDDDTLFDAEGHNDFVEVISSFNSKMYTDPLTGAYNRTYYTEQLQGIDFKNRFSFIYLDIDNFKKTNDTYTHRGGDFVLQETVSAVRKHIRKTDRCIRMGGDEFLIVLLSISRDSIQTVAEKNTEDCPQYFHPGIPGHPGDSKHGMYLWRRKSG